MKEKIEYEIETRWFERGRQLNWGYAVSKPTLVEAIQHRTDMLKRHTDGPIVSGYELRIVRVTTKTERQVLWLEGSDSSEKLTCSTCLLYADGECGMCREVRS